MTFLHVKLNLFIISMNNHTKSETTEEEETLSDWFNLQIKQVKHKCGDEQQKQEAAVRGVTSGWNCHMMPRDVIFSSSDMSDTENSQK